jgi:hypothetical protein
MPQVRSYQRQVDTTPIPRAERSRVPVGQIETPQITARPTAETFGAEAGATLETLGSALYRRELEKREQRRLEQDEARLRTAARVLQDWELQTIHDPKTGALTRLGESAFNLGSDVGEAFDKFAGEQRNALSNDRQRLAYDDLTFQRRQQIMVRVLNHEDSEIRRFHQGELAGAIQNSQQLAGLNANDPRRVADELDNIKTSAAQLAASRGLGPDEMQASIAQAVSDTHLLVISGLLSSGQDINARTYFKEFRGEIAAEKAATIEEALQVGSTRRASQIAADAITADKTKTLTEALEEAGKLADPSVRDDVESRIKGIYQVRREVERQEREDRVRTHAENIDRIMRSALNAIDAKGALDLAITPVDWSLLTAPERNTLESYAKRVQGGGEVETDLVTYYNLMTRAADQPDTFSGDNLLLYINKLGKTEFKQLTEIQASIRKGRQAEADKQLDDFRTETQVINNTLGSMGVDPGTLKNNATVARVHQMVGERVQALARLTGKRVGNDAVQKIVDEIVSTSYTVDGWIWDTQKPLITIKAGEIPSTDRKQIEEALRQEGRAVTDDAVLDLFIRTQQRLRAK